MLLSILNFYSALDIRKGLDFYTQNPNLYNDKLAIILQNNMKWKFITTALSFCISMTFLTLWFRFRISGTNWIKSLVYHLAYIMTAVLLFYIYSALTFPRIPIGQH